MREVRDTKISCMHDCVLDSSILSLGTIIAVAVLVVAIYNVLSSFGELPWRELKLPRQLDLELSLELSLWCSLKAQNTKDIVSFALCRFANRGGGMSDSG